MAYKEAYTDMSIEKDIEEIEAYIPKEGEVEVLAGIGKIPVSLATDSFKEFISTREYTPSEDWKQVFNRVCRGVMTPSKMVAIMSVMAKKAEEGDVKAANLVLKIVENMGKQEEQLSKKEINVTISYSNESIKNEYSPQVSVGHILEAAIIKSEIDEAEDE